MSIFGLKDLRPFAKGAAALKKENKKASDKYPLKVCLYDNFGEDFDGGDFTEKKIDKSYKYIHKNIFYKIWAKAIYRLIFTPVGLLYSKFVLKEKFYGKEKMKKYRGRGRFVYANHTQAVADAFSPHVITIPECAYTVISSKNFKLPVLGRLLPALGGLPLPTELSAARNFSAAIKQRIGEGRTVVIFPEGHLWPYCTFLRPFSPGSFDYPVRLDCPAFAMTRVYVKRGRRVGSDVYIDGPFFPDGSLSPKEAREKLAAEVKEAMEERLALTELEVVRYERREAPPAFASAEVKDGAVCD